MPRPELAIIDTYAVNVVTDGTTTEAEITVKGPFGSALAIGKGSSRRRRGDKRSAAVGELLALARTFENAAENARKELDSLGYGDVS